MTIKFVGLLLVIVAAIEGQNNNVKSESSKTIVVGEFECPEEFGYYPHPRDCTQYYVCVFGGALLESCTGGLMYSHELQTCDWPRNVGCNEDGTSQKNAYEEARTERTSKIYAAIQQETRRPERKMHIAVSTIAPININSEKSRQRLNQRMYHDAEYEPATEVESDRQQRVYRGQPSTIGQVHRDRDGLRRNIIMEREKDVLNNPRIQVETNYRSYTSEPINITKPVATTPAPPTVPQNIFSEPDQSYPYYTLYDDDFSIYKDDDYEIAVNHTPAINVQPEPVRSVTPDSRYHYKSKKVEHDSAKYNYNQNVALPEPSVYKTQSDSNTRSKFNVADNNVGTQQTHRRTRPTLKPSTEIVSKAQEFVDIYRFPPTRPAPIYPTPQVDKPAAKCRKDVCLLPDCSCGGTDIPGDYLPEEVPQIVLLTFDDSVNDLNKGLYEDLFERGRTNPNGCPISASFYVSHEWTDYSQVQNLYAAGHEIASHTVSHSFGEQFSQRKWAKEVAGQREILSAYGGVKLEDVRGMRAPFLSVGGNNMFKMLWDTNFTYDSSMPIYENRPPSWPYTLDYKLFHDCMIPPCPTRSYPGLWEVPMVMWQDLNGGRCSMGDACSNPPTPDGVYKMLIKNFERHYTTNRAPFGLFYHAAWFTQPHHKEGFISFLDTIVAMDDVWVITNWQALQWIRNPTPIHLLKNFAPFGCNYADRPRKCNNPKVCNLWHKSGVRYMKTCQACPDVYPWTGKTGIRSSRIDNEISLQD